MGAALFRVNPCMWSATCVIQRLGWNWQIYTSNRISKTVIGCRGPSKRSPLTPNLSYKKAAFCMEELILLNPNHHLYHQKYAEVCPLWYCCTPHEVAFSPPPSLPLPRSATPKAPHIFWSLPQSIMPWHSNLTPTA